MGAFKKSPPDDLPEEEITDAFRTLVRDTMRANAAYNAYKKLPRKHTDRRIGTQAELARASGVDPTLIKRIIGGAREDTDVKPMTHSRFLGKIRAALGLPEPETEAVQVPIARIPLVRRIAAISEEDFKRFSAAADELLS